MTMSRRQFATLAVATSLIAAISAHGAGRFLILAYEELNKIIDLNAPSWPGRFRTPRP
jgi:hypothetical protein